MLLTALTALSIAAASPAAPAEKQLRPLPTAAKAPVLDGVLKDWAGAQELKVPKGSALTVKATFKKDTLYVSAFIKGAKQSASDTVQVALFFPNSGTTAKGATYAFGFDGQRTPVPEQSAAPEFAKAMVQHAIKADDKGVGFEVAIPARALPRFQGQTQLALNLCVDFITQVATSSTCPGGELLGGPVRIPDELRKNLKLTPPSSVEGIEARATGWVGYAVLHYPVWILNDAELTPDSLGEQIAGDGALVPKSVNLPIPPSLQLPDKRPIYTVLTGKNPYSGSGCTPDNELRMAMYVVKGNTAARVLEWPAATCSLGRAVSFELSPEGNLTIGYSNGSTAHFSWSVDHFERSELGLLDKQ